ncbi:uncharacterized protein K452DRAFT_358080 [Aplosporella prunicola CBS 121167]|uniref:Acyl-CoA dehydrogenase NM domain-like protein n=1 Tax=Aplosporella prunicola CBS 121167 TaxID=1176127 RepID=A0A6A6BJQ9_9PEZI|nr:uncharacterized protein K452DRAFT_358080 [Aplosporella prunicola CBS 121167]KAF2143057.1 hypothetical protein K452DRAFT_358080 [Aplosporella prunicola CBS 121167]
MSKADLLANTEKGHLPASQRIPPIALPYVSERAKQTLDLVEKFVEEECIPADAVYHQQLGSTALERFSAEPSIIETLKSRARSLGLWNLFLPKSHFSQGAGFSNLEYGLMAEYLGKSRTASEATNCSAPDTGNMEVLAKYGDEAQKKRWLEPLLRGECRSAFLMTEPGVASSDARNIELSMRREGAEWVLNGQKWWSSGAGDPRCQIYVVMGKSDAGNPDPYKQQSVILVPADTPGITVHRMLSVMGYDDAPHGHGHISFANVRVPAANMVLGPGRGFEIIQGRLGPGRIHHAMRSIGAKTNKNKKLTRTLPPTKAERALEHFAARLSDPRKTPFGAPLSTHELQLSRLAHARININAARLTVLNAAISMDLFGPKAALREIAAAKILVPKTLLQVLDDAMQAHGGAGVSQDTPLANMWAQGRTMRIVDGPDEVHVLQVGKGEVRRGDALRGRIEAQRARAGELFREAGLKRVDPLALGRKSGAGGKAKL